MNPSDLRAILKKQPFRTLEIRTTSGQCHVVNHPESIALLRDRVVVLIEAGGSMDWFDVSHVSDVRRRARGNGQKTR